MSIAQPIHTSFKIDCSEESCRPTTWGKDYMNHLERRTWKQIINSRGKNYSEILFGVQPCKPVWDIEKVLTVGQLAELGQTPDEFFKAMNDKALTAIESMFIANGINDFHRDQVAIAARSYLPGGDPKLNADDIKFSSHLIATDHVIKEFGQIDQLFDACPNIDFKDLGFDRSIYNSRRLLNTLYQCKGVVKKSNGDAAYDDRILEPLNHKENLCDHFALSFTGRERCIGWPSKPRENTLTVDQIIKKTLQPAEFKADLAAAKALLPKIIINDAESKAIWKKLEKLTSDYYDDYKKCSEVIWVLANHYEKNDTGRDMAHNFCKKSSKYNADWVDGLYDKSTGGLNIGSLNVWVKACKTVKSEPVPDVTGFAFQNDNECDSDSDIRSDTHDSVESVVDDTETETTPKKEITVWDTYDIHADDQGYARIFVRANKDSIVVIKPTKDGTCYIYNDTTALWELKENTFINAAIGDYLEKYIGTYRTHITKQLEIVKGKAEKEELEDELISLRKILKTVRTNSANTFIKVIVKLYRDNFEEELNKTKHLFPILNAKVINLKTGELLKRTQSMKFSFECPVNYRPLADLSKINKYFASLMKNDSEMFEYLQRVLGYSITGETQERVMFIMYGNGRNGKGACFELIKKILKEWVIAASRDALLKPKANSHHASAGAATAHLMPFQNCRIAMLSEIDEGDELHPTFPKNITGEDSINSRPPFGKKEIEFKSQGKIIFQVNTKPKFSLEQAMIDRIRYIPWNARFTTNPVVGEYQSDPKLIEWLNSQEGMDLFITWIINGSIKWYATGFGKVPKIACDFTKSSLKELDTVSQFIDDKLETDTDNSQGLTGAFLYDEYKYWAKEAEVTALSNVKFGESLKKKMSNKQTKSGIRYFGYKIKVIDEEED